MNPIKTTILFILFISSISLNWAQENGSTTINNDTQQQKQERIEKEKAKAEYLKKEQRENNPNSTNLKADKNKLISKPYFIYRNQVLDGMNVVGKGVIRKFDRELTNEENIKALNEWIKENKELFKPKFLNNADEYFIEALRE